MRYIAFTTDDKLRYDLSQNTLESLTDSLVFYSSYCTDEEKQELIERSIKFLKVIGSMSNGLSKDPVNPQHPEELYITILKTGIRTFFRGSLKEYSSRTDEFGSKTAFYIEKFLEDYKSIKGKLFLTR